MLKSIALVNYRNLTVDFQLDQKNLLIARNGAGKSNLMEAIYLTNFGKSFHPIQSYEELIGPSEPFSKVNVEWSNTDITTIVSNEAKLERRFIEFGKKQPLSKIVGRNNVILFSPATLNLVAGEPQLRRDDMDDFLTIQHPDYGNWITHYSKALKNRNAVIKMLGDGRSAEREYQHFTNQVVELAAAIYSARSNYFDSVKKVATDLAEQLYNLDLKTFDLHYHPNIEANPEEYAAVLAEKYYQNKAKEIVVGKTLYGVHKDDFEFTLNGKQLRYQGSRGQQRLAGLILKLAQLELLKDNEKETVLLVDDLMSELDDSHRVHSLRLLLAIPAQVIMTAATNNDIPEEIAAELAAVKRLSFE